MSGDVQPRKRKNDKKRRRGNENVVHTKCFDFFSLSEFLSSLDPFFRLMTLVRIKLLHFYRLFRRLDVYYS